MKHGKKIHKLQRNASQRKALLSNLAGQLIEHGRIRTTLAKAKALRPVAEKLVTLAKRDDVHTRRQAVAYLRQKELVQKLFTEVAPAAKDRQGGYCRIIKLGFRTSDAASMALIEWVDRPGLESAEIVDEVEVAEEVETEAASAPEETPVVEAEVAQEEEVKEEEPAPVKKATAKKTTKKAAAKKTTVKKAAEKKED